MKRIKRALSFLLSIVMAVTAIMSTGMVALASSDISPASLLPLKEVKACLLLGNKSADELSSMKVEDMLSMLVDKDGKPVEIPKNATTVWKYVKSEKDAIDEYVKYNIGKNEIIDLSVDANVSSYTMELIVGSSNQLDKNNIRYIVKVYISSDIITEDLQYELYLQDESGFRQKVIPEKVHSQIVLGFEEIETIYYMVPEPKEGCQYYLGISSEASQHPNVQLQVNSLLESDGNEFTTDITDNILNQDMEQKGAGYPIDYGSNSPIALSLFYYINNQINNIYNKLIILAPSASYIDCHLYEKTNGELENISVFELENTTITTGLSGSLNSYISHETYVMIKEGYSPDSELYCVLDAHGNEFGDEANSHVVKAVEGYYNTLEEASSCPDIKDKLIPADKTSPTRGYKGNYSLSNGGITFTIFFDDGNLWKVKVAATQYDAESDPNYFRSFNDKPIIGETDPWFRVTGATDSNGHVYDTYAIENGKSINMDTYYGYGYQTLFINDADADLTRLKPNFWYANTDRVYAVSKDTGAKVEESHIRDFSNENQQYTGVIIDNGKENNRNYWVTFKKLNNSGPELYVFGPKEREVILDEYFEYKHDILIANIGNAPLQDLSVELKDAENVKLDPYWTVGGANNDTLAPFTTTSSNTEYGEISNIAKIRLLPDGDGKVKGTLIIKAKGQDPVLIELNGTAQQPEIVTETLSDAVKYVPYSHIVATNNIHDWNEVTYELYSGELPDGVELNTQTGEIYGIPQESGKYNFTVEAKYTYFNPSFVELTLDVKDNTNDNVFEASDDGYAILDSIGEDSNGDHNFVLKETGDQTFRSNGAYNDFVDFWLNGEKLIEGVDYDASEGSTRITIRSQTFAKKANQEGSNTIAAEFRTGGGDPDGTHEGDLKRTAQNFTMDIQKSDPAVDNVIFLINAIPDIVRLSDKDKIEKARAGYNSLTDAQKEYVTNYGKLTAAEQAIAALEENESRDRAAASAVIALIDNIPSPVTLNDRTAVNNARNAYENLTAQQKAYVSNFNKLKDAENRIKELEEEEKVQVPINKVISLISAIPDPVTLNDKAAVRAARKAYDALTDMQKRGVVNYNKLTDAESTIAALEALEKANAEDKAAAEKVTELIQNLPSDLTLSDKDAVNYAREAYDALTDIRKGLVTNYSDLVDAEEKIAALEAYENAVAADKEAANKVIDMIEELPDNLTLNDSGKVKAARDFYDALTETQKQIVTNYSDLVNAEVVIAELKNEEYQNNRYVTFIGRVVDAHGKPMENQIVEMHSTVKTARTDSNGFFRFNMVDMGSHSIVVKDSNGNVIVTKNFVIVEGTPLSLSKDTITAENRSTFTVTVEADGNSLTFKNLQEGDRTVGENPNEADSDITESQTGTEAPPKTGYPTNPALLYSLMILSLLGLAVTAALSIKKRNNKS